MKNIVFIRHGKSSWEHNVSDIDRPLKKRGVNDAYLIANAFKNLNINIDSVFTSPAKRAYSTCIIITKALEIPKNIITINDQLYDFAGQEVINFIQNLETSIDTVLLFGHNNAFTSIINALGNKHINNLPTTGLAIIEFDTDNWKNLSKGKTVQLIYPKSLR